MAEGRGGYDNQLPYRQHRAELADFDNARSGEIGELILRRRVAHRAVRSVRLAHAADVELRELLMHTVPESHRPSLALSPQHRMVAERPGRVIDLQRRAAAHRHVRTVQPRSAVVSCD